MRKIITTVVCFVTFSATYPQAPGTLNKNFGTGGIAKNTISNSGTNNSTFYAVEAYGCFVLANGKLILLLNLQGWAMTTQRLPNGEADSTYGKNGFSVSVAITNPVATLQPDGKIVIAGTTGGTNENFIVARLNTDGSLDKQFGNNGVTITDAGSASDILSAVVIAPNGQIIAGGQTVRNNSNDFALIRYNSAGKVDASFGQNGIVVTNLGGSSDVTSLAVQPDNKILATGDFNNGTSYFAVTRYKTNGVLDTSFNHSGVAMATRGNDAAATSMALSSGKIIVGGYSYNQAGNSQFNILQLTVSGAIDSSFGTDSWAYSNLQTPYQELTTLQIAPNGRILTGGFAAPNGTPQFALAKFLPNGIPDSSFGTYGQVLTSLTDTTQDYATCMFLQTNGDILLGGFAVPNNYISPACFGLVRYQSNGATDNGFAANGILVSTYPNQTVYYSDILLQPDGKLLVFGGEDLTYYVSPDYLWRYTVQGAIDPTYGRNGRANVNFLGFYTAIQSDGKALITGNTNGSYTDSIQVGRYLTNGNLDPSYGTGGMVSLDFLGDSEFPNAIAIQSDNKTIVGGWTENILGITHGLVTRLNTNGTVDASFGTNGLTIFNVGSFGIVRCISIGQNGKILLSGAGSNPSTYQFYSYVARLKSNGVIDSSFGQNGFLTFTQGVEGESNNVFSLATGKILFGYSFTTDNINYTAYVTRLNANGSTDSSYGTNGTITIPNGDLALEPDLKLLVLSNASDAQNNSEFLLTRYLTNESLDLTFGQKGSTETNLNPGTDDISGAISAGNELAITGTAYDLYGIGLAAEYNLGPQTTAAAAADLTVTTDAGTCSAIIKNIETLILGNSVPNPHFILSGANQGIVSTSLNQFAFNKGLTQIRYYIGNDTAIAGEFSVNVEDKEPPSITGVGKSLANRVGSNNLLNLRLSYDVSDNCGATKTAIAMDGEGNIVNDHFLQLSPVPGVHTIRVTATDESGNESIREDTVLIPTSILKSVDELRINADPNPSINYFSVHISASKESDPLTLQLFNDKGALIETFNHAIPGQTLKLAESASPGVYFLKAIRQREVRMIKLVKL